MRPRESEERLGVEMTRRRRFLQATGASAAAILLNPTGLMAGRSPTCVAQLPAQEWEGFLLVPPGGVRPRRSVPAGPGWPEVTEGSAAGTPTPLTRIAITTTLVQDRILGCIFSRRWISLLTGMHLFTSTRVPASTAFRWYTTIMAAQATPTLARVST